MVGGLCISTPKKLADLVDYSVDAHGNRDTGKTVVRILMAMDLC